MKAALFDMDGLMFDTERLATSAWLEVAKEMKFDLRREQIDSFRGSNKEFKRGLFAKWYGSKVDYDEAFRRRQEYIDEYIEKNSVPLKKGLIELMTSLKEKGYKIAVATSTSRKKASLYWEKANVTRFIDESVCGDEVTKSKPDPEIFLLAAKKLNVDIKDCYVLEDSENGLEAGHKAGAKTIMIPDMTKPNERIEKNCDYIFNDLSQVIEII